MEQRDVQNLQEELRTMAHLHNEYANHLMALLKQIGTLNPSDTDDITAMPSDWVFKPNDYSTLTTWLLNEPWARKHKFKYRTESWPAYAIRLSKYVGWDVDDKTLRRAVERRLKRHL